MEIKTYLYSLIVCGILSKGIGTSSEVNTKKSLELLVRQKRIIDKTSSKGAPVKSITEVPYIVNILRNKISWCAGTILSVRHIITSATCFVHPGSYTVLSNSVWIGRGKFHRVFHEKRIYPGATRKSNDLALALIEPEINFNHSSNSAIKIYNKRLRLDLDGIISGWGIVFKSGEIEETSEQLQSTKVPLISVQKCIEIYPNVSELTNKCICTYYEARKKCCADGDLGAPLVVEGMLVGIFSWTTNFVSEKNADVFMNLMHPEYRRWILKYIPEAYENPRKIKSPSLVEI